MSKKYTVQKLDKTDKKGKKISETIKLIANDNNFIAFQDANKVYKELAKKYNTKNIQVLLHSPAGYRTYKKAGEEIDDLYIELEDYYTKNRITVRNTNFDKLVDVEYIFVNPKVNNNKILRKK